MAVAVVARRWPLAQRDGGRHGRSSCRHRRAATAHCHGGDKDTGSNSDGGGTYNNQQLTKRSGGNGNGNGNNDSDDDDNGNKGDGGSGSLARARRWRWRQCGGGIGSGSTAVAARQRRQQGWVSGQRMHWGTRWKGRRGGGVAVLVELGRGVPHQVPRAVDVGRRAKGRESKGKDEGEGNVNGNSGSNGGKGEEGHNIGGVSGGGDINDDYDMI